MKKIYFLFMFCAITGISFAQLKVANNGNDTTYCITNPLQELKWLREKVEIMKANPFESYIYKCIYNYQEGFLIDICFRCPDVLVEFYDCEGNVICESGGFNGRITCPDFDSSFSNMELIWTNFTSSSVYVDKLNKNGSFSLYPNPIIDYLVIDTNQEGTFSLEIYTNNGKIMHKQEFTPGARINLSKLSRGLYFIIISNKNKEYYYETIFKN